MDTFANSEDPDEFHKGLHCLLRSKRYFDKKM